jgi:hypothetical protein
MLPFLLVREDLPLLLVREEQSRQPGELPGWFIGKAHRGLRALFGGQGRSLLQLGRPAGGIPSRLETAPPSGPRLYFITGSDRFEPASAPSAFPIGWSAP